MKENFICPKSATKLFYQKTHMEDDSAIKSNKKKDEREREMETLVEESQRRKISSLENRIVLRV